MIVGFIIGIIVGLICMALFGGNWWIGFIAFGIVLGLYSYIKALNK